MVERASTVICAHCGHVIKIEGGIRRDALSSTLSKAEAMPVDARSARASWGRLRATAAAELVIGDDVVRASQREHAAHVAAAIRACAVELRDIAEVSKLDQAIAIDVVDALRTLNMAFDATGILVDGKPQLLG
jgi:hypothetical protein